MPIHRALILLACLTGAPILSGAEPLDSRFTYQGQLDQNNQSANGPFDFEFRLFDAATGGNLLSTVVPVDDLDVNDGLFSVALDFGDLPFSGDRVYLQVSVREGSSSDPHTDLTPRQEVTSAPYALHAQFVAENTVGSAEIEDGSVSSQDLATDSITTLKLVNGAVTASKLSDNSVAGNHIVDGSIAAADVNPASVQHRVSGSCPAGQSIRAIASSGTVTCEVDDTGGVTSNSVGSDAIIDGSIAAIDLATNSVMANQLADQSVNLAAMQDDSVGANQIIDSSIQSNHLASDAVDARAIADGSVGSVDVNSDEIQLRISGSCALGMTVSGIDTDGTLQCVRNPGLAIRSVADDPTNASIGMHSQVVIRDSGRPLIAYYDSSNRDLKLYSCSDELCTTGTARTLDSNGDVGTSISMKVRLDGRPILSYYDDTNGDLKLYDCIVPNCGAGFVRVLESIGDVGETNALLVRQSGLPIVTFYDRTNAALKLYDCNNVNCSSGGVVTLVDEPSRQSGLGGIASIIRPNGNPIIAYRESTFADLRVFTCTADNCSSGTDRSLDSDGSVGGSPSILLSSDVLPVIAYSDATNGALKFIQCLDLDCITRDTRVLDNHQSTGLFSNMIQRRNGLPLISYYDSTSQDLKVYDCLDASCQSGTPRIIASEGNVGFTRSGLAVATNGMPIISYHDNSNSAMIVLSCADESCLLPAF